MIILFGCSSKNQDTPATERIIKEFNKEIIELPKGSPLDFPDASFASLDSLFNQAQIIGLGEATHGTKEFFELKHRLIRYLVENFQVQALGFEFDFRFLSSLKIERFVTEGKGNLNDLFTNLYWTHRNEEVWNLINWMRNYNFGKREKDKVHFLGIDSQLDIWHIYELGDYIRQFDESLYECVQKDIGQIKNLGKIDHKSLGHDKYAEIKSLFDDLKMQIEKYLDKNPYSLEKKERELIFHLINSYLLSHELRYLLYQKRNVRDRHMAEHCIWLKNFVGENNKVVIWAHNAHVAKNPHYTSDGSPAMGEYLREKLGNSYLSVATSFSEGFFAAMTDDCFGDDTEPIIWEIKSESPQNSINYLFRKGKYENFIFPLSSLSKQSSLYKYINQPKPFLGIGDFFTRNMKDHYSGDQIINLARCFDVLFQFNKTQAINILKKSSQKDERK